MKCNITLPHISQFFTLSCCKSVLNPNKPEELLRYTIILKNNYEVKQKMPLLLILLSN